MTDADPALSDLAAALRLAVRGLYNRLREQTGGHDFTEAQKAVLLRLDRDGPMTASALARAEGMRPQSMAAITGRLEADGHLRRKPDAADGRRILLATSESFQAWLGARRAMRQDWLTQALGTSLTAAERHRLADALPLIERLAGAGAGASAGTGA